MNHPTRKEQILAVAESLFREKGYLATSMRDIADGLNMKGGGSLYAHIKGKEELLAHIANTAADAFFAAHESVPQQGLSALERLYEAMIAHMLVITAHLSAAAVYFDEWRHLGEPSRSAFLERRDAYESKFKVLIKNGITAGELAPADDRLATLHVLSAMNAIRHWYKPNGRLSADQIAEVIAGMLLDGLKRR